MRIGDESGGGCEDCLDDAEVVGAEAGAGFGVDNDRFDEVGDFDFACSPAEFDFDVDALIGEIALGEALVFGGDRFAIEIFGGLIGAVVMDCDDDTDWV